jgi:hypothetical protein
MSEVIRQHLLHAKQRMKRYADGHHSERQFHVNDWVFLKLQPYVQSSVANRSSQKLAFNFFGPYQVLERVGSVAYRLALPSSSLVHHVFHVSQLKKAVGARHSVTSSLPPASIQWSIPERILQRRQVSRGKKLIQQGLIQWTHLPASLATWEDLEFLQQQFPRAGLWNQHGAQVRGNVSTPPADRDQATSSDTPTGGNTATEQDIPDGLLPGWQPRPRTANPCFHGPNWVNK